MTRLGLARALAVVSIAYAASFYFVGAAIKPGYSQIANFISEYNATGTPHAELLTYAGFGAVTVLLAAFLVAVAPYVRARGVGRIGFHLLWAAPASYALGFAFPCDAGCPLEGSFSQQMHNWLAIVAYAGTGLALMLLSRASVLASEAKWAPPFLLASGAAWIVMFVVMLLPEVAGIRGLIQRSLDVLLAGGILIVAFVLAKPRAGAPA